MRYINICEVKPGMKVGKTIYMYRGEKKLPMVNANAILSEKMVGYLQNMDLKGIYISDSLTDDIIIEDILSEETINNSISAVHSKNIDSVIKASIDIVNEIYSKRNMNVDFLRMIEANSYEEISLNICELALALANEFNFNVEELSNLAMASLLCNIGKMLSKEDIKKIIMPERLKNSNLSLEELSPVYGYQYLKEDTRLKSVTKQAILFSCENENGTGYPFGLVGKDDTKLTKYSKILLICSKYESYLREYGNPIEARNRLYNDYTKGIVDKSFTEVFVRKIPIYPISSTVLLSNNEYAIIVKNNDNYPERPVVRTFNGNEIDLLTVNDITILELFCNNKGIPLYGKETVEEIKGILHK